mmetsp:Transcript_45245/g.90648  ORF Transcript_45245/g.90648 Transcript_45245/m.90648 type:complete len:248 (-) Transcript_45245:227-970(-)
MVAHLTRCSPRHNCSNMAWNTRTADMVPSHQANHDQGSHCTATFASQVPLSFFTSSSSSRLSLCSVRNRLCNSFADRRSSVSPNASTSSTATQLPFRPAQQSEQSSHAPAPRPALCACCWRGERCPPSLPLISTAETSNFTDFKFRECGLSGCGCSAGASLMANRLLPLAPSPPLVVLPAAFGPSDDATSPAKTLPCSPSLSPNFSDCRALPPSLTTGSAPLDAVGAMPSVFSLPADIPVTAFAGAS